MMRTRNKKLSENGEQGIIITENGERGMSPRTVNREIVSYIYMGYFQI